MDAEAAHLLALFDYNWFRHRILADRRSSPPPPPIHLDSDSSPPPIVRFDLVPRRLHHRSFSDEIAPPPETLNRNPNLQTIQSGKEVVEDDDDAIQSRAAAAGGVARRRGIGGSRSMSELEFEELKGFMDLGFDFADVEADPRLMSLVPGLQRLRAGGEELAPVVVRSPSDASGGGSGDDEVKVEVARPYLSEAWEAEDWRLLRNWRVPAAREGVDMKDHLRFWAHAVASAVR